MILQALTDLHSRLSKEDGKPYGLPIPGYSVQNVTFRIVLNPDGSLNDIQDARETVTETLKGGKTRSKQVARKMLVPGSSKPSGSGINPCFLWDNSAYLLGYKKPDKDPNKAAKEAARALETLNATREQYLELANHISGIEALRVFYQSHWTPEHSEDWKKNLEDWKENLDDFAATGFGVFRILPDQKDVHERSDVKDWWASLQSSSGNASNAPFGFCLVTGQEAPIARLHEPALKGVNGAAPGGAKLASFNLNPFESYGKDQSFNSPVSEEAVFAYCNALNALLSGPQSHRHRVTIGDATTIFWTEKKTATESLFAPFLSGDTEPAETQEPAIIEDQGLHTKLDALLKTMRKGGGSSLGELGDDPSTKFYILGLSGNVTRLVVRFWHVSTIEEMLGRLRDHYENLRLKRRADPHPYHEPEFPSAQRLLDQSARERKAISPLLGGQLMQAILHGTQYPLTLYQGVLNRLRANDEVNYLKASIIKATLFRNFNQSIDMSLNTERTEPAYLLGRLFASLEKTQEDALGKVNAGIRERFYSSASATPGAVFPRILRTYQHHLGKLDGGLRINRERLVQSIHTPLDGYPSHLNLEEQGLFAIGYYHQRQDFFTKKNTPESDFDDSEETATA